MEQLNQRQQSMPPDGARKKKSNGLLIQGLIALGLLVFSFVAAFFLYIPYINEINDLKEKQTKLKTDISELQNKYTVINSLGVRKVGEYLVEARKYVPDDIRIAELATFINANAQKYNLVVSRLNLSENKIDVRKQININIPLGTAGKNTEIILGQIEGPFTINGSKGDIFKFLDFLVDGGYATNFDRVSIVPGANNTWTVNFVAVHHFLPPAKDIPAAYPLIPPRFDLLTVPTTSN